MCKQPARYGMLDKLFSAQKIRVLNETKLRYNMLISEAAEFRYAGILLYLVLREAWRRKTAKLDTGRITVCRADS